MNLQVGMGRRFAALVIDWLASYAIVAAYGGGIGKMAPNASLTVLAVFFAQYWILVTLQGASLGHRLLKLKVVRFSDGGRPTPLQILVRTLLICLVVTAITFDENGRGIHERLSNTVLSKG